MVVVFNSKCIFEEWFEKDRLYLRGQNDSGLNQVLGSIIQIYSVGFVYRRLKGSLRYSDT